MAGFRIEPLELMRLGPTYTRVTLRTLRKRLGPSIPLVLILGGDQWKNLHTWKNWQELAQYADLAVCRRGGEAHEASATEIRRVIRAYPFAEAMKKVDGWLPLEVAAYIRSASLYGAR